MRNALIVLLPIGFLLVGCQAAHRIEVPTQAVFQIANADHFIDQTLTTLRAHDFEPSFVDRAGGLIITAPRTSGQWFEFWRRDVVGGYQMLESSIHTVRRRVRVTLAPVDAMADPIGSSKPAEIGNLIAAPMPGINPMPEGGRFTVRVRVEKQRLSMPERQITTASGALSLYDRRVPTLIGPAGAQATWLPAGRDAWLEEALLGRLAGNAAVIANPEAAETQHETEADAT